MHMDEVTKRVEGLPHMSLAQAKRMTDIVIENRFQSVLELGFRYGVSSCYIAAALDSLGGGTLSTIDLLKARSLDPNIEQLLADLGLQSRVSVYYENTSYTWRLMKFLEESPRPQFDFCYIDGAHSWFVDGFAFFLVDLLLKPGGLIVFDDLNWTHAESPTLRSTEFVATMPEEEKTCPQVRKVYELLVKFHPAYVEFAEDGDWAFARKRPDASAGATAQVRSEVIYRERKVGLGSALFDIAKSTAGALGVIKRE